MKLNLKSGYREARWASPHNGLLYKKYLSHIGDLRALALLPPMLSSAKKASLIYIAARITFRTKIVKLLVMDIARQKAEWC